MSRTGQALDDRDQRERMVRIVISDRSRMASQLLADVLARKPHFAVVAVVVPDELLATASELAPEIVVLSAEVDLDPARGVQIAATLHARMPEVRTIILADACDREVVIGSFRAGARGIFCRADNLDNFGKCIERVHEGQIWADNGQLLFLVETLIATAPYRVVDARGRELLSGRELEVVQLAVKGYTNREIADRMKLSEHTVKNYLFRAFDKLGVSNRVEMLFYVLSQPRPGLTLAPSSRPDEIRTPIAELQAAAEAGSVSAQLDLGTKFRHGAGVERSKAEAYFWLRVAEERAKDIGAESKAALQRLASAIPPAESEAIESRVLEWLDGYRKKTSKKEVGAPKKRLAAS